ncbi:MAG: Uncharacterised protein [Opitutia bacterium UBA7350]|nr:MAG: Uncharacterised protein [Opitutae bacterium UBA7350]
MSKPENTSDLCIALNPIQALPLKHAKRTRLLDS